MRSKSQFAILMAIGTLMFATCDLTTDIGETTSLDSVLRMSAMEQLGSADELTLVAIPSDWVDETAVSDGRTQLPHETRDDDFAAAIADQRAALINRDLSDTEWSEGGGIETVVELEPGTYHTYVLLLGDGLSGHPQAYFGATYVAVDNGEHVFLDNPVRLDGDATTTVELELTSFPLPGTMKWYFQTEGVIDASPAIADDGTIYIGSGDRNLYALNPDGTLQEGDWPFEAETFGAMHSSPAIGDDGTIYVGSGDANLYALNPDGTLRWNEETGDSIESSPAIGSDGTVYVGSDDGNVYAFDPDDGSILEGWPFEAGGPVASSPAIAEDGTVYVGSRGGTANLHAISPDGTLEWDFFDEPDVSKNVGSSPAIGDDGTVYVGSNDEHLYAIDPDTGEEIWAFEADGWVASSPAIGKEGTIYAGSTDGNLYAINPDGTEKWVFEIGENVNPNPTVGDDGTIYVGSYADTFFALNPDGTVQWTFETGWWAMNATVGPDGVVYMGSRDENFYAIYSTSGGIADSPWPQFGQNWRRTSRR